MTARQSTCDRNAAYRFRLNTVASAPLGHGYDPVSKPVPIRYEPHAYRPRGSRGAYTWGVLDALLASRSVATTQLSRTSAGAINAAIVARLR